MTPARRYERPDAVAGVVPNLPIRWCVSHTRPVWHWALFIAMSLLWTWTAVIRPSFHSIFWASLSLLPGLTMRFETRFELTDDGALGWASFFPRPFLRWSDVARAEIGAERLVLHRASGRGPFPFELPTDPTLRARIRAAVLREVPATAAIEERAG